MFNSTPRRTIMLLGTHENANSASFPVLERTPWKLDLAFSLTDEGVVLQIEFNSLYNVLHSFTYYISKCVYFCDYYYAPCYMNNLSFIRDTVFLFFATKHKNT